VKLSLSAFHSLVAAVAELHKKDIVHRDIKPANIFIDTQGNLVLGDLGLVYFSDDEQTRVTETWESVGTTHFMPTWAYKSVDEVPASFDVYSLGKILWCMLSGKPRLIREFHHEEDNELEKLFPESRSIHVVREILDQCIVERENQCLNDASELINVVDEVMVLLERNAQVVRNDIDIPCRVCGRGLYFRDPSVKSTVTLAQARAGVEIGTPINAQPWICNKCGHVELFAPKGWKNQLGIPG
jgi:serine/threonine protein kinase